MFASLSSRYCRYCSLSRAQLIELDELAAQLVDFRLFGVKLIVERARGREPPKKFLTPSVTAAKAVWIGVMIAPVMVAGMVEKPPVDAA